MSPPLRLAPAAELLGLERVRADFPILGQRVRGKPLVYLDSAATTQKPRPVIEAISRYYGETNANVHRGVHLLSQKATDAFEGARAKVKRFLNARSSKEIIFTRGTTEAINLVAQSFGRPRLAPGDEILLTVLEHHSNIVPWQLVCEQTGAHLKVVPMTDEGELRMDELEKMLSPRTRVLAMVHVSNALGTVNPVARAIALAHAAFVPVLLDGAQAVAHLPVDVQALGCDFYAFSAHKLFGPTGVGVLYGRQELLEAMPPYQGGGDMIRTVSFEKTTYNELPYKFEAGTPDIAGVIGLGEAVDWVKSVGLERMAAHEADLLAYGTAALQELPGLRLVGTAREKAGILSFVLSGVHPHDVGTILDADGIAVRTGHHCAQPLMERLGLPATTRASLAVYNTRAEIDALVAGLAKVREVLG